MARFCFYNGSDAHLVDRLRRAAAFCWSDVEQHTLNSFHLFAAAGDAARFVCRSGSMLGAVSGYARHPADGPGRNSLDRFIHEVSGSGWPLGDEWAGSFAAVVYSAASREVTLCNDLLGPFPLYYTRAGEGLIGGTGLIPLGRALNREPDAVGVLQRITVPFCNYGRRTLLKKVFRLLPGERLKWGLDPMLVHREYDNTLCGPISPTDLKTTARRVFDCLRDEINAIAAGEQELAVATSGGWDSRLVLGGMPSGKGGVSCFTYGGPDLYETRIAQRCAEAVGASHESFPIEGKYFPARHEIEALVKETESANYFEWFGIIEEARSRGGKPLLFLGDLCESIDGRYMSTFSSRKARINSYLGGIVGLRETFEKAGENGFERWCERKTAEINAALRANVKHLSDELRSSITEEQVASETSRDLAASYARVNAHAPPFAAMYDELFIWFHRIRFLLGDQINWLGSAFRPVSPGLSMRFLRHITTVHPRLRIRKRLMNAIVELPEFDRLAQIPSSQIPFLPARSPAALKDAVWGLRSGVDQLMIRRTLRKKNANGRQRVLRSLDYVKEYRRGGTAANVEGWFSGKFVRGDGYLSVLNERAQLNAWTLINVDIAAPANVGMILDLCAAEADQPAAFAAAVRC